MRRLHCAGTEPDQHDQGSEDESASERTRDGPGGRTVDPEYRAAPGGGAYQEEPEKPMEQLADYHRLSRIIAEKPSVDVRVRLYECLGVKLREATLPAERESGLCAPHSATFG
jgi:hypothetical protein